MVNENRLIEKASYYRKRIMEIGYKTQSGHLSSALSAVELLTGLYDGGVLRKCLEQPKCEDRDRFILSKGHACILQYIILKEYGLLEETDLLQMCKPGGILGAHPDYSKISGIEASTGSLGHGLAYGIGCALAARYRGQSYQTYVLIGDGESQEGSIWESALVAGNQHLNNLTVIMDYNHLQASDYTDNISTLEPITDKWKSFGFDVYDIDGNDMTAVMNAFQIPMKEKPKAIIAYTLKGKGVGMIENKNGWHGRKPNDEEWKLISKEMRIE